MPRIDLAEVPLRTGSIYPAPYDREVAGRSSLRVGDAGGLTQFGANIVILEPGARSSMRHWHENEDEFVMAIEGDLVLIEDEGETPLAPGDCAAFPAGSGNAHCIVNRGTTPARFLVVGTRAAREVAHYPDHGLKVVIEGGAARFLRADGSPLDPNAKDQDQ